MRCLILAGNSLALDVKYYVPLIIICAVLAGLLLLFKLLNVTSKVLWKTLINGMIGAGMLCLFDIVFMGYMHMNFFFIPVNWVSSLIAGLLGIPGVLLLLIREVIK